MLFANPQDLSRPALERYAREVGLDLRAFRSALDRKTFAADVDRDLAPGRKMFLSGAPAVLLNAKRVEVPYGVEELSELLGPPRSRRAPGGDRQKQRVAAPCFRSSCTLLAPVITVPGMRSSCV